jgi:hypothetical protein
MKCPNGEYRPADTVGCAVHIAGIAMGEIDDSVPLWSNTKQCCWCKNASSRYDRKAANWQHRMDGIIELPLSI